MNTTPLLVPYHKNEFVSPLYRGSANEILVVQTDPPEESIGSYDILTP